MTLDPKLLIAGAIIAFIVTKKESTPISEISKKEKEEVEKLLTKPVPKSFVDYAGREWTPCSDWFLGENIPDWPVGIWPGQVKYLYKPIDVADWLGCIAGYNSHIEDLEKAITVDFKNETKTVETTRLITLKRKQLQKYVACRLKALKKDNLKYTCEG